MKKGTKLFIELNQQSTCRQCKYVRCLIFLFVVLGVIVFCDRSIGDEIHYFIFSPK